MLYQRYCGTATDAGICPAATIFILCLELAREAFPNQATLKMPPILISASDEYWIVCLSLETVSYCLGRHLYLALDGWEK